MTSKSDRDWLAWASAVFAVAAGVYLHTLAHGFVFDDDIAIVRNVLIRAPELLPQLLTTTEWSGGGLENHLYRPLASATYALNYGISGLAPWSYHILNVLLHGAASVLVLRLAILWRLPLAVAALSGLLFAVHPIHVEAVANVIGRKDVLASCFLLLMVLAHDRAIARRSWWLAVPVISYGLAMLSKEVGVVGIGLVVMQDWLIHDRGSNSDTRTRVGLYLCYAVLLAGFILLHRTVTGGLEAAAIPFIDNPAAHASLHVRLLTAVAMIGKGFALLILPFGQRPDYSFDSVALATSVVDARVLLGAGFAGAWLWLGIKQVRSAPVVLAGWGWYFLTLLPGSNLLFPVGTIFGERLLYAPSIGFSIAVAFGLHEVLGRVLGPKSRWAAAALVIIGLGIQTVRYASAWEDDLQLFEVAVRESPNSTKAQLLLAGALYRAGELDPALTHALRAVEITPENGRAAVLAATILWKQGKAAAAHTMLDTAMAHTEGFAAAFYLRGRFAREQGDILEAVRLWHEAVRLDPRNADALSDLGTYSLLSGDTLRARRYLERSVASNPGQASAWFNLARLNRAQGRVAEAMEAYAGFLNCVGRDYAEMVPVAEAELLELESGGTAP